MKEVFENLGYFKEYWLQKKSGLQFMGTIACEKDRNTFGYEGRQFETVQEDIVLSNKKVIKAYSIVQTILYPLCGKSYFHINKTATKHAERNE